MTEAARQPSMAGHVLICGITELAVRIVQQLTQSGVSCLVLDDEASPRLLGQIRAMGVPVRTQTGSVEVDLGAGEIRSALAVLATADSDIDNLELALHAAELAPGVRLVVALSNPRLGEQLQAALPNTRVLSLPDNAGPGFVEACVQSTVLHAFRIGPQALEVVDVEAPRAGSCRELYGTLTPLTLRRLDPDAPLEVCPGRDARVGPGDRISLLGRRQDFAEHGIVDGDEEVAEALVALSAGEMRGGMPRRRLTPASALRTVRASVQALVGEIDRPVRIAVVAVVGIVLFSTVLLRVTYHNYSVLDAHGQPITFGWLQALYFTTTIVATVGFGDFSFAQEPAWLTAYGIFLILVGAAAVATLYALVTNFILSQRLEQAFGRRQAITSRGHVIVVGLGSIGLQVVEGLLAIGWRVVVIETDDDNRNLSAVRARRVPVVLGDATSRAVLRQANIREAAAVAVMTSSDLANVESALTARSVYAERQPDRPRLRVVVRIFDTSLADKVEKRFGINAVRSASALAAPWFVGAALGYDVVSTFYAQRQAFLVARMRVHRGAGLDGVELSQMGDGLRVVAASAGAASEETHVDVGEDAEDYRLTRHTRLQAGSEVLLVGGYSAVIEAFRANVAASGG